MTEVEEARQALRACGEKRSRLSEETDELRRETARALQLAEGKIPKKEAAALAGIHRVTAYDYRGGNDGEG